MTTSGSHGVEYPFQMHWRPTTGATSKPSCLGGRTTVSITAFPDQLLSHREKMAIRERHVERFREPNLHGKLINRIVMGNMVIDHETVTRTFPKAQAKSTYLYL